MGLAGCSQAAAQPAGWDVQLGRTIPGGMQQASIRGAIVGVWKDGEPPYVRAFGVRESALRATATPAGGQIRSPSPFLAVSAATA
jgi:D-alanyl-D-alanine carboxypeptidase